VQTEEAESRAIPGLAPVTGSPAARRRGPAPMVVLAIASLGAAVAFVDATIVNIAFPSIELSFHGSSISTLSWVLNAYNIVFASFLVAAGRLADLLGRRRMFIAGLELFTVASLLCAISPSPGVLIGFRVVQALGAALLVPASLALVLQAFDADRRSHGVALLSAVAAAAAGLGPSIGGLLVSVDDWRLVFLVNLPIGAAAILLARRRLVESRAPGVRRVPDLIGAGTFATAIAALVLGVVKGGDWGWANPRTLGCFAAAVVLGSVVVWRSRSHRAPIIDLTLLRIRSFSAANAMTVLAAAGFYGYTLTNVLYLTGVWGYSVLRAGLALTIGPFIAAAVAGPTSRLVQRIGHRPVLVAGGLIWGGAVLWFVERVGLRPDFLGQWLPGMALLGIGAGTLLPNLSGAAVAAAPGESFATATGLNSVARQLGAAIGVSAVVALVGTPTPLTAAAHLRHAWTFGAICLFAAGVGCLLVSRITPEQSLSLSGTVRELRDVVTLPAPRHRPEVAQRPSRLARPAPDEDSSVRLESLADFLALAPLFAVLAPEAREQLAARARELRLTGGDWLFHEGEPGDTLYLVRSGRLEVVDELAGIRLRELARGDAVGELGLLTDAPRSASVRALRTCELVAVDRPDFERLLAEEPAISVALSRGLAAQLRDVRAPAPSRRPLPATVAVVGLDPAADPAALARALDAALGSGCYMLDGSEVALGAGMSAAGIYGPLVDRAELAHDLIVLSAGTIAEATPWTEFSIAHADRILAVATGTGPAARKAAELRGCDLVARDVAVGSGALTAIAEELAPLESHQLARETFDADVARIARRITGRSLGIVLSGGGARGFAHIGVLEELADAGLVIDRVAGVSMGAYVGALCAMGLSADEIDARCFEEWVQRRPLSDYTLPRHGLIRGDRVRTMLHRSFGTAYIEELPLSFMCGCTELRSGALVLSRSGPLWERVGFSINLPLIGAPEVRGREMFVDGSLVDNLPVAAMADMGEGPIIAVDVKPTLGPEHRRGEDPRPTGQRGSGGGTAPVGERPARTPLLPETLARVLLLASEDTVQAAERHADLIIRPRPPGVGLLEFHQLDAAREAGRVAAREALERAEL
jgi:NTE family protein